MLKMRCNCTLREFGFQQGLLKQSSVSSSLTMMSSFTFSLFMLRLKGLPVG